MKSKVFVVFLAVLFATAQSLSAAAPQAVLSSLKGKVEIKSPGSKAWVAATEGQVLATAATLSTGFDSSVVVTIDKTTIQVKPLTRMTIDKLVEDSGTVKTSTFLRVGSVSASVKSAEGVKQDFKVQSPYSTASVRGTEFDYDGLKLAVREGLVAMILGRANREAAGGNAEDFAGSPDNAEDPDQAIPVAAGQDAQIVIDFTGAPPKVASSTDKDSLDQSTGQGGSGSGTTSAATKGSVTLTVTFPATK